MAEYTDVQSGFDLEAIIDENILRHILQILTDAEQTLWDGTSSFLKNFEVIDRDYDLSTSTETTEDDLMRVITVDDDDEHIYLALAPLNFEKIMDLADTPGLDTLLLEIWVIVRIKRSFNLINVIENLQDSEGDNVFGVFGEALRIEGLMAGRVLDSSVITETLVGFKDNIRGFTETMYIQLTSLFDSGAINFLPDVLSGGFRTLADGLLFDSEEGFELFLTGLHNIIGISGIIKDAVETINTDSPLLFERIRFRAFTAENKIGLYGNLNTIDSTSRGNVNNAEVFAGNDLSGIAANLTGDLVEDLFLSMMRFEMLKKLNARDITQARFDEIEYAYPFSFPSELLDEFGVPQGASFFEINRINVDFRRYRFPDTDGRTDAVEITIVLSNDDEGFFEGVFDAVVPNPRVRIFLGFDTSGDDLQLLFDLDVNIPFNLFTALLTAPLIALLPGAGLLFSIFGFTIVSNIAADIIVGNAVDDMETDNLLPSLGFSILKKRWDPFYTTHHQLKLNIDEALINQRDPQIKLTVGGGLTKGFEPYTPLYIESTSFNDEDRLEEFTYKLDSVSSVLTDNPPAVDRIEDMYSISSLSRTISASFTTAIQTSLGERESLSKIKIDVPYSPQFVRLDTSGSIALIRVLSDLRKNDIRAVLLNDYIESEVQKVLDLFFELIIVLIPDYDLDSITDAQLAEITTALEGLIRDSGSYDSYRNGGWEDDLTEYLEANTGEMLTLSPLQLVLMGMSSVSVGNAIINLGVPPNEIFNFLEMPGYQALAIRNLIFIRNSANDTRSDNLLSLPEF